METKTTIIDAMNAYFDTQAAKRHTILFSSPLHIDKRQSANDFYELVGHFSFILGRGEQLTKQEFIKRYCSMYDTESSAADPRNKFFKESADNTSFLSITRDRISGFLQINF